LKKQKKKKIFNEWDSRWLQKRISTANGAGVKTFSTKTGEYTATSGLIAKIAIQGITPVISVPFILSFK
jgi:hypothetical protein